MSVKIMQMVFSLLFFFLVKIFRMQCSLIKIELSALLKNKDKFLCIFFAVTLHVVGGT